MTSSRTALSMISPRTGLMNGMTSRAIGVLLASTLATACGTATALPSAGPLDRSVMPQAGPTPSVDFPEVERHTLSNGLSVWLVERPNVPLVTIQLLMNAGAVADPNDRPGLASLTAAMLTEG